MKVVHSSPDTTLFLTACPHCDMPLHVRDEFWDDPIADVFSEPDRDDSWQEFVDDWRDSQHRRLARLVPVADEQVAALHDSIAALERAERLA